VSVGVGEPRAGRQRGAVDAVEAGARHLDEAQPPGRRPHLARERERDQDVHSVEPRGDAALVGRDHLARDAEMRPHPILQPGREGAGEGDAGRRARTPAGDALVGGHALASRHMVDRATVGINYLRGKLRPSDAVDGAPI
jgi:hypothetical protein